MVSAKDGTAKNMGIQAVIAAAHYPLVVCFSETKAGWEQLRRLPGFLRWLQENDYNHLYAHWSSDECPNKHGHAGLLVISKIKPSEMTHGVEVPHLDIDARLVILKFKDFVFVGDT